MSLSAIPSYSLANDPNSLVPTLPTENAVTAAEAARARAAGSGDAKQLSMFAEGDDSPSFMDLLDVINPLQHIPLVNNLYREATGDKIGVAARLVGGTLFGGPVGLLAAAANCMLEESTGQDAGGHVLALFRDEDSATPNSGTALAASQPTQPAAQSAALEASTQLQAQQLAAAAPKPAEPSKPAEAKPAEAAKAQPLVLDLDGAAEPAPQAQTQQLAAIQPAAAATPAKATASATQAAAARPMALGREGRFMPLPGRNTPIATQPPPSVSTTISTTGLRSEAPVTGYRPSSQRVAAATAQQMAGDSLAGPAANAQNGDWFASSMMQAMNKYEQSARLGRAAPSTVTVQ